MRSSCVKPQKLEVWLVKMQKGRRWGNNHKITNYTCHKQLFVVDDYELFILLFLKLLTKLQPGSGFACSKKVNNFFYLTIEILLLQFTKAGILDSKSEC